jgi:hypothetical protein
VAISFNRAREAVAKIRRHQDKCVVIHYSCQSLYDDKAGLSPSIANIVIKDLSNDQTVSFAAHIIAEKLHIPKDEITKNFDTIEAALLEEFYDFVRNHSGSLWLHWNMTNIQYGFETLSHRYSVLTKKNSPNIDVDSRINIASILFGLYGEKYVSVPHMPKLMTLNGGVRRDFIAGIDEVEVFKAGEYARLHASTLSKVKFFSDVVELILDGKLKTENHNLYARMERGADSLIAKLLGLAGVAYTLFDAFTKGAHYFHLTR